MVTDALISRELKSLQDEMSAAKAQRTASTDQPAEPSPTMVRPAAAAPDAADLAVESQLRQFANELTEWFGEAEKSISAHPAQSVAGALLVGILIGRLLGRR